MATYCHYSPSEWEDKKETIYDLYIAEKYTLTALREALAGSEHNFRPSKNKLLEMLREWKFSKYSKREVWAGLPDQLKRKGIDLRSQKEVEVDGRLMAAKKLKKELSRYREPRRTVEISESPVPLDFSESSERYDKSRRSESTSANQYARVHSQFRLQDVGSLRSCTQHEDIQELPMFQLILSVTLAFLAQCTSTKCPTALVEASTICILLQEVKTYVIDTVRSSELAETPVWPYSMQQRLIMQATSQLTDLFSLSDSQRQDLDDDDKVDCVESILPVLYCDGADELHDLGYTSIATIATVSYLCHLALNELVSNEAWDMFIRWAAMTDTVRRMIDSLVFTSSSFSDHLRTLALHAAIRTANHAWAELLFDPSRDQTAFLWTKAPLSGNVMQKVSPLQAAIIEKDVTLARLLLKSASVQARGPSYTPCASFDSGNMLHQFDSLLELVLQNRETLCLLPDMFHAGRPWYGTSIAVRAIWAGAGWDLIETLMSQGADLYEHMCHEDTDASAVHAASIQTNTTVLNRLLMLGHGPDGLTRDKERDPNAVCKLGCCLHPLHGPTPIMLAADRGAELTFNVLVESGAELLRVYKGQTAMSIAMERGNISMVRSLLRHGDHASVSQYNHLLVKSARAGNVEILHLPSSLFKTESETIVSADVLHEVAKFGSATFFDLYVGKLTDSLDERTFRKDFSNLLNDIFITAVQHDSREVINSLFRLCFDAGEKCSLDVFNALGVATDNLHSATTMMIIQHNHQPRRHAVANSSHKCLPTTRNRLLSLPADADSFRNLLDLFDIGGGNMVHNETSIGLLQAPMHLGLCTQIGSYIEQGVEDIALVLRSSGCSIEISNTLTSDSFEALSIKFAQGESGPQRRVVCRKFLQSLSVTKIKNLEDILDFLIASEYWEVFVRQYPLLAWAFRQHQDSDNIAEKLVDANVPINPLNVDCITPLQSAIMNRRFAFVMMLLEENADVNAAPGRYWGDDNQPKVTCLQAACYQANPRLVQVLIDVYGADVNQKPNYGEGQTALQIASSKGYLNIVRILINAGAVVETPDLAMPGGSAIEMGAQNGRLDVLRLLLLEYKGEMPLVQVYNIALSCAETYGKKMVASYLRLWTKEELDESRPSEDEVFHNMSPSIFESFGGES